MPFAKTATGTMAYSDAYPDRAAFFMEEIASSRSR